MGLLIIAGGGFVPESRTYKTNGKTKTIGASLDMKEKINVHYTYNHSAKKHWQAFLYFYFIQMKVQITCFRNFYTVQVDTVYQRVLFNSCLFLFLRHSIRRLKEHILHKQDFIVFYSKKKKKKFFWFFLLYRFFFFFLSKNVFVLYILKIFFTMLHLKIFLEYWIILYIFRISLCVRSPLKKCPCYDVLNVISFSSQQVSHRLMYKKSNSFVYKFVANSQTF